jgi:DNA-binding MarR family transcriptional regulator
MAQSNEIIHQTLRLKIMTAVCLDSADEAWDFSRLKKITEATDGNLGSHLGILEQAGYVSIEKDFVGKRPRTRVSATSEGRRAFREHVEYLRDIVERVR